MESLKNQKLILFLICLFFIFSCVEQTGQFEEENIDRNGNPLPNISSGGSGGGSLINEAQENKVTGVHIKNFNQINMSLSKLTGISRSNSNVVDVMGQILNQLPASNDLSSFTPFHQISITRLAFTYCEIFIDNDSQFSTIDYGSESSENLTEAMIVRFLDEAPSDELDKYDVLRQEMISVLDNEDLAASGKLVDESGVSREQLKRRLSKMACSIILSSSFVTLI